MQCRCAGVDRAQSYLSYAEVRSYVSRVVQGTRCISDRTGGHCNATEYAGLVARGTGAVADFVLQRSIEYGLVRGNSVGQDAGGSNLIQTSVLDELVGECEVSLLSSN